MTLIPSLVVITPVLAILSITLIHHYATPGTPLPVRSLASLSFFLGFGGIALLPIDLSLTQSQTNSEGDEKALDVNVTYLPWQITYWSTFLLAWLVLPLVREFLLSGHFTFLSRMRDAGKKNVRGYILLLAFSVIAIITLAIQLHSWDVIPVLMTVGNTYGLLLVSLLLGYGLVDLPKNMWRIASPEQELRRKRIMASAADEALFDAVWALQDCEDAIDSAMNRIESTRDTDSLFDQNCTANPCALPYHDCVDQLLQRRNSTAVLDAELQSRRTNHRHHCDDVANDIDDNNNGIISETETVPSYDDLARLNAQLKLAQAKLVSAEQRWSELVDKSDYYAALVNPVAPLGVATTSLPRKVEYAMAYATYLWRCKIRSSYYRLVSVIMAVLSILVLWSEATMALPFNLSPFAFLLNLFDTAADGSGEDDKGLWFKIAASIPLLYMSACVYGSLFKIRFFGPYCLRGYNQSPGVALLFNAQYLIRMQFSLGYNYLLMIKYDVSSTNCAFSHIMNNMSTVPFFGTSFSFYAPLLILMLCGFTLCDGYTRLLAVLGVEHEDVILMGDQETLDTQVNEGILLLKRRKIRGKEQHQEDEQESGGGSDNGGLEMSEGIGRERKKWWHDVV